MFSSEVGWDLTATGSPEEYAKSEVGVAYPTPTYLISAIWEGPFGIRMMLCQLYCSYLTGSTEGIIWRPNLTIHARHAQRYVLVGFVGNCRVLLMVADQQHNQPSTLVLHVAQRDYVPCLAAEHR